MYPQSRKRYLEVLPIQLFHEIAREAPDRPFSAIPRDENLDKGFYDVTFAHCLKAVDYVCSVLRSNLGPKPEHEFETLTYLGAADMRYPILTLAAMKCGYKILLPSLRNTTEVNSSLMEQTKSSKVIHSAETTTIVDALVRCKDGRSKLELPSLDEILKGEAEHVPYNYSVEEGIDHPIIVLHSSGSTGAPKPVQYTNAMFMTFGTDYFYKVPEGRKMSEIQMIDFWGKGGRIFAPFPPFHVSGMFGKTITPLYSFGIPVWSPPMRLPTAELVSEMMDHQDIRGMSLPPSVAESLLHYPGGFDKLKKLEWLMYAGGPLSQTAGDEISKHIRITQAYGSTEMGSVRQLMARPGNWQWIEFHPDECIRLEPADEEGTYELVVFPDPARTKTYPGSAVIPHSMPGLPEFRSKDLFTRHPNDPSLWKFYGRRDDIFVLSSGEKFNPLPMESSLNGEPMISGAVVVGVGKARPALLVEPKPAMRDDPDLLDKIWAAVKKANGKASQQGRVSREMIIMGAPDRPFHRAGKGTVIRKMTTNWYQDDIDALYNKDANDTSSDGTGASSSFDAEAATLDDIKEIVQSALSSVLPAVGNDENVNIYMLGMDSLMTADATASIASRIGKRSWLAPNLAYTHPSIADLSQAIFDRLKNLTVDTNANRVSRMEEMIEKYTRPANSNGVSANGTNGAHLFHKSIPSKPVVAVTGTTGSLGSELVATLLESSAVSDIVCLNRSADAQRKWEASGKVAGGKHVPVKFLTVDFSKPNLGLDGPSTQIVQSCDALIHNAWKVDFNQSLASFEDNLLGLRNIINLATHAERPPHIVFISSVSSTGSLALTPEVAVTDLSASFPMGYAESKLVSERILDKVCNSSELLPVTVLRVGQIAGSTVPGKSPWPDKEAFPGMFKTSRALGLVPNDLPPVNWIPIDQLAHSIMELSLAETQRNGPARYYNLVNPHATSWKELVPALKAYASSSSKSKTGSATTNADTSIKQAKEVSLAEWVDALRKLDRTDKEQLASKPALKTLEFFEGLAQSAGQTTEANVYETKLGQAHSVSLANLQPVDAELLSMWLDAL